MKLYDFIGPAELRENLPQTARALVQKGEDVGVWARTQTRDEPLVATFVVDATGMLWIADRRSEHVACARGGRVQTAGELGFEVEGEGVVVRRASNQSSGFCPRVESWAALGWALDGAGIEHPGAWTTGFEFRRCEACGALNVVKEEWFVCAECDSDLPRAWNIGNESGS